MPFCRSAKITRGVCQLTSIIGTLSIFLVGVFALMIASLWYMKFLLIHFIGKKHEWIEFILDTSTVPPSWSNHYNRKISIMEKSLRGKDSIIALQKRASSRYIQRIDKLMRYVKVSNLMESEDVRKQLIDQLMDIRKQWERGEGFEWIHS